GAPPSSRRWERSPAPRIRPTPAARAFGSLRTAAPCSVACAAARPPTWRSVFARSTGTSSKLSNMRPSFSSGCCRESGLDGRAPPLAQLPLRPELPPLLHRAARLGIGQLDADGRRGVAVAD